MSGITDVPVYIRETQGTRYHLSATLKPNRYYMLVLTGKGYEVEGGKRYWIDKVETNSKGKLETFHQQWIQHKFFYFRTKGEESIPATPPNLKPYVALAYPAGDDLALFNSPADKAKAYDGDLAVPTIALNQDISTKAYKDGKLYWELRDRRAGYTDWDNTQKRDNVYKYGTGSSSVNMEPASSFSIYMNSAAKNKSDMEYNLRLCYQYRKPMNCATGLEEYASDQEKWAAYRGFIKNYVGYVDYELPDGSIITVADLPGYGRKASTDEKYKKMYIDALKDVDIILLIIQANDKAIVDDIEMVQCLYEWSKEKLI
jgi:hypothetical protein